MTSPNRYRIRQAPTDVWSIRERLCLASSVLRSGDQNWVSVSRAIKPFGEPNRPPDWFSQKNCALQYSDLLEKVEAPKRKRWDRADKETPGDLIVRKLTMERVEELKKSIQERQIKHRKLKREVELVKYGHCDDKLDEILSQMNDEIKAKEETEKEHQKWLEQREEQIAAMKAMPRIGALSKKKVPGKISRVGELKRRNSSQSEQSEQDSAVDSPISEPHSIEVDDAVSPLPNAFEGVPCTPTKMAPPSSSASQHPTPSTSPLLTSLLKSPTPTAPASPIGSILSSPSLQPKEGTLASQLTSPRSASTPQPFFSPTSALATAAARQLAVATAPLTPSGSSLFSSDKLDSNPIASSSSISPAQSVTLSAPTLSKLLEMPPSVPGKLPPLPIVHPPANTSANTLTAATTNIQSRPADTLTSVAEKETSASESKPLGENKPLITPVISVADTVTTSICEDAVPVAIKVEPPDSVSTDTLSDLTATAVCHEDAAGGKEEVPSAAKLSEPNSPNIIVKKENDVELSQDSVMHGTDIVIESKGVESGQDEEQVIVMEVDFAGEVKDEKGEIIEVFEVTAPEGSIVELEYETICEEEPLKTDEHVEIRTEERPHDENAVLSGADLQVSASVSSASKEREDTSSEVTDTKEETFTYDAKLQDGGFSKISEPVAVKEGEDHEEMDTKVERKPPSEEKIVEEEVMNETVMVDQSEQSTSEYALGDFPSNNDETLSRNQDESEQDAEVEPNANDDDDDDDVRESQLSDTEETKDEDMSSVAKTENVTSHEVVSVLSDFVVKEETEEEGEEEQIEPAKKDFEKDELELMKEKSPEETIRQAKQPHKKVRRGRGRSGGKTYSDVEMGHKPFQGDVCKSKDDEEEDDDEEQKVEVDMVESVAGSETSEVVSLDQSAESGVEQIIDAAAEVSVDSDENFAANESGDASRDNLMGNESLEEESAADQSQISAESEDKHKAPSSVTDSIPNSPASTAPSDDQESIREYKVWKKAIMLVWRAAANHKFANVFLHPVTNDVAPGYHSIVYRPMDLSVIKKNIENGIIRSTIEFQRDMMLMFQNAIMYNSSDHDVYHMALEMQKEVMEQIQDFLATQLMLQTAESKVLRGREREARERKAESTEKEDDLKRKRSSLSSSDTEVKVKKRKT